MDIVKIRRINDTSFYFKEMVNGYLFCMCHNNCHFIICGGWSFIGEVWSYISQKLPLWRVLEQKRLRWIVMLLLLSSTCCAPGLLELCVMEVNWTSVHLWRRVQRYVYCYKTREWPFMFKVCTHTLACKRAMHWLLTEWLLILKANRLTKVWLFKNHRKRLWFWSRTFACVWYWTQGWIFWSSAYCFNDWEKTHGKNCWFAKWKKD